MGQDKAEVIRTYATNSTQCLRRAFKGKSPTIAQNLSRLGRRVGERTVRKMTEESVDVTRRNVIENACLVLGACFLTDRKAFETVWGYLETFADELRGKAVQFKDLDEAVIELRYRAISVEKIFYQGDVNEMPEALRNMDETVRGVNAQLILKA